MANKVNVYSKPFVITVFIFLVGVMIGIWIDTIRTGSVENSIKESEIMWEDTRLLNMYINTISEDECNIAFEENLAYNSRIYEYGKDIEKKIDANTFTPHVKEEWRKYNLLQFQFWLNSDELKEKCGYNYSNVIYLSRKDDISNSEEIDNKLQSSMMMNLKENCGRSMMLIPLTADIELETVNLLVRQHNITDYPAVIIDNEHVFQGVTQSDVLEEYMDCPA